MATAQHKFREFVVTTDVLEKAEELGLVVDTETRVLTMARFSAPYTDDDYNRRYVEYLFKINKDQVIVDIGRVDDEDYSQCNQCHGTLEYKSREVCDHCSGIGCKDCGYEGRVEWVRPCIH